MKIDGRAHELVAEGTYDEMRAKADLARHDRIGRPEWGAIAMYTAYPDGKPMPEESVVKGRYEQGWQLWRPIQASAPAEGE